MPGFWTRLFGKRSAAQADDAMKYLIAGLGNPGAEYEHTRHNAGFLVADELARRFDASFSLMQKGEVARFKYKGRTFILLKPSTYMNRSGSAVRLWMQKEKVPIDRLLVIVDDLSLPLGKQRLRGKGSDGGHNGLKDINQVLGRSDYARLRIGIGDDFGKGQQADYVLSEWTAKEEEQLPATVKRAADTVLSFATIGLQRTMNQFNG
jgi:PTH1 family peptidyl-tRNA hydrolase